MLMMLLKVNQYYRLFDMCAWLKLIIYHAGHCYKLISCGVAMPLLSVHVLMEYHYINTSAAQHFSGLL